jgi:signal transduction histidine kinase
VWHRLDQPSADSSSRSARRAQLVRVGGGLVLVIGGWSTFLGRNLGPGALRDGAAAAAVLLAGVALLLGPWLARLLVSVGEERDARVRAAERADVAAHLHDSVLQTLALLQKRADDPTAVSALARHQERELRRWLYGRQPDPDDVRFGDAVDAVVAEVEDHHLVRIEAVVVGDALVDDRLAALVAATREALVNAAKFSGTPDVSLYAELDGDAEVYVRDRGKGFDPELVPSDRRGIADSIVGRLARVGGTADVRSTPGEGTEVHLHLPAPTRYPHTRTGG